VDGGAEVSRQAAADEADRRVAADEADRRAAADEADRWTAADQWPAALGQIDRTAACTGIDEQR